MPPGRGRRPNNSAHKDILRLLSTVNPKTRRLLLQHADKSLIYSICEIALNFLSGHIPVSASDKQKLSKYKNILRKLAVRGESWQAKKKIVQTGGGAFLPILLSVLGPLVGKLIFGS